MTFFIEEFTQNRITYKDAVPPTLLTKAAAKIISGGNQSGCALTLNPAKTSFFKWVSRYSCVSVPVINM
ncbi:MAG: hypothetical protein JSR17_13455 [Proteobacteria bacterium]|nr:hypothetical protein [Pseudomonadota bacterium]